MKKNQRSRRSFSFALNIYKFLKWCHLTYNLVLLTLFPEFFFTIRISFCSKSTEKNFSTFVFFFFKKKIKNKNMDSDWKEKRKYWFHLIACFISIVDNKSKAMLCDSVHILWKTAKCFPFVFFPAKQSKENGSIGAHNYNWMASLLFSVFRWFEYVEFSHWSIENKCRFYPKNVQYLLCSQLGSM